ncbi:MAG: glycosyltransferase family 4 protein [Alphaproteobacteria bacterium]|nr:glycosyltransferase family 4 protein [Alphaproteobacteria bacterium]
MRRPTILFMNRVYPPMRGATGRLLRDLARAFARQGWHVTVVTCGAEADDLYEKSIRVIRVKGPAKPKGTFGYVRMWFKLFFAALRQERRHVVVSMSDPPLLVVAGSLVAKIKGSYHINWCQDLYPEVLPTLGKNFSSFWMSIFMFLRRRAMNSSDRVIVIGRCMARYLTHKGGGDAQKVTVIPNWPDLELVDPEAAEAVSSVVCDLPDDAHPPRPFDKQLKTKPRFRILYAGTIGLAHPVDSILEVARILEKEGSDVEFVFVGDGPGFDELARLRSERGLDNIRFIPFQPITQLRDVMESGDVHLISMKEEAAGFIVPSKLYAALAVARPCIFIGPEQCECAKVIRDYGAGVVVPQGDSKTLLKAVKTFRESGEAWFGAHNGALQAREVYTPNNSIDAMIERAWDLVREDLERS